MLEYDKVRHYSSPETIHFSIRIHFNQRQDSGLRYAHKYGNQCEKVKRDIKRTPLMVTAIAIHTASLDRISHRSVSMHLTPVSFILSLSATILINQFYYIEFFMRTNVLSIPSPRSPRAHHLRLLRYLVTTTAIRTRALSMSSRLRLLNLLYHRLYWRTIDIILFHLGGKNREINFRFD